MNTQTARADPHDLKVIGCFAEVVGFSDADVKHLSHLLNCIGALRADTAIILSHELTSLLQIGNHPD